jgi:hypothetical protein
MQQTPVASGSTKHPSPALRKQDGNAACVRVVSFWNRKIAELLVGLRFDTTSLIGLQYVVGRLALYPLDSRGSVAMQSSSINQFDYAVNCLKWQATD